MTRIPYYPASTYGTMAPPTYHLKYPSAASIRAHFLHNAISATYNLPPGSILNFTMVEIITLLPHLYKEPPIAYRFLNNHMTTGVHFAILSFHRSLDLASDAAEIQAREIISEGYRRAMRVWNPTWTKASHVVPASWDPLVLSMENFEPVAAREKQYRTPAAVPFRRLMDGVKMLPRGSDKGDLTRALEYALAHAKADGHGKVGEWMFPDDIQTILDICGRTEVKPQLGDRRAVRRWADKLGSERSQLTPPPLDMMGMQSPMSRDVSWEDAQQYGYAGYVFVDQSVATPAAAHVIPKPQEMLAHHSDCVDTAYVPHIYTNNYPSPTLSDVFCQVGTPFYLPPAMQQQMTPSVGNRDTGTSSTDAVAAMDELLRPYLSHDQPELAFHLPESGLIRDLPEPAVDDVTDLASAVRFAKQPDQVVTDWHFDEVHVLTELLKSGNTVEDDGWLDLNEQM
jgi:hypothetical protein